MKLSNQYRPLQLADIVGQGSTAAIETLISRFILNEPGGCFWVEGPPGTGKTSVVEAYVRTLLCHNRPAGSATACGTCPACTAPSMNDISSENVMYYSCETPDKSLAVFEDLKKIAVRPPFWPEGTRPDQFFRVLIIDEVQNASSKVNDRISVLLEDVERQPDTTIWFFITSHPEDLDAKTLEAISSRCQEIRLHSLSPEVIAERLAACADISPEAASALAHLCNGNLRRAWSEYEALDCRRRAGVIPEITPDAIYDSQAGGASDDQRLYLWRLLQARELNMAATVVETWLANGDSETIGRLLLGDLNKQLSAPGVSTLAVALAHWLARGAQVDSLAALLCCHPIALNTGVPATFKQLCST